MKQFLIKFDLEKVFFNTEKNVAALKSLFGGKVQRVSNEHIYLIELSPENSFLQAIAEHHDADLTETGIKYLRTRFDSEDAKFVIEAIQVIEENRLFFIEPTRTTGHGIADNKLWGQHQIRLPQAREILPRDPHFKMPIGIAAIDTGVHFQHPDLEDVIWRSSEKFSVSLDGKNKDFPKGAFGFNVFEAEDNNKRGLPIDNHYHGTMVAGIIGAKEIGVARAYEHQLPIQFLAVKAFEPHVSGGAMADTVTIIKSLDFIIEARKSLAALKNPIDLRIVNISFGYFRRQNPHFSLLLEKKIKQAADQGILFVSATGNNSRDLDTTDGELDWEFYPAGIDCQGMIAVTAIKDNGELWEFSNYGKKNVHIAAPGYNIYTTTVNNNHIYKDGTSLAAPFVSASAALLLLANPKLENLEIKTRLIDKANRITALPVESCGSLDLYNSLQGAF